VNDIEQGAIMTALLKSTDGFCRFFWCFWKKTKAVSM